MPKPLQYNTGSLIYCQGEDAEKIYLLQGGKVSLVFSDIESGQDMRNQIQPGEFFGVKSALGRFPREENAMALADSTIMAFTVPEFESLAMSNTRIILKMLKVFSNQMRRAHAQISTLTETATDTINPEKELFTLGEKYLKNKRYAHAKYIFSRYLAHYPAGKEMARAENFLSVAENSLFNRKPSHKVEAAKTSGASGGAATASEDSAVSGAYYEGLNFISEKKYKDAFVVFKKIIDAKEFPEWTMKSSYEAGHCLFLLNKFDDCIKYFNQFLTLYPEYPDLRDAMFFIGQSYEKLEDKEQAINWYKKIVELSGEEKDAPRTKALKAMHELEKK